MPDEAKRKQLVLDYFDRVNAKDIDAVCQMFTVDARIEDPVGTGPVVGAEAVRGYFQRVIEEFGTQDTPGTLTGSQDEEHVAAALKATIRNPQDPNGGRLAVNVTSVFRFTADGLIAEMRAYWGATDVAPAEGV
ncbi:nuclear transport factor 2 family protein [Streptomyces sp. NPDC018031]|uniref:nuclear transport factor 2 family protein n=1 Tax=Streptomyces sp. NPDC018031 TaxID=3365033 RepID=UPI00379FCC8C